MKKDELVKRLTEIYGKIENLDSEPLNNACAEIGTIQTKLEYLLDEVEDDTFTIEVEKEPDDE